MKSIKNAPIGCTDFRPATTTTPVKRSSPNATVEHLPHRVPSGSRGESGPRHRLARRIASEALLRTRKAPWEAQTRWIERRSANLPGETFQVYRADIERVLTSQKLSPGSLHWSDAISGIKRHTNEYLSDLLALSRNLEFYARSKGAEVCAVELELGREPHLLLSPSRLREVELVVWGEWVPPKAGLLSCELSVLLQVFKETFRSAVVEAVLELADDDCDTTYDPVDHGAYA